MLSLFFGWLVTLVQSLCFSLDTSKAPWLGVSVRGARGAQVRLWDVPSGVCLATHSFQKPIASLAFHCDGQHQLLAVASGHKVHLALYSHTSHILVSFQKSDNLHFV